MAAVPTAGATDARHQSPAQPHTEQRNQVLGVGTTCRKADESGFHFNFKKEKEGNTTSRSVRSADARTQTAPELASALEASVPQDRE